MIKFLLSYDGRKPTERRQSRQNAYEHFEGGSEIINDFRRTASAFDGSSNRKKIITKKKTPEYPKV